MVKILVVDDSTTDRKLIVGALEGYTVLEATNGDEAIDRVRQSRPNLIILDVVMPGKSGFQTCRELRKMPEAAQTPIVMLTTKHQPTDQEWGLRQGANAYLTKPFTDEDLLQTVRRYL
jgi:twitching motility two-component system response regulator PilH